MLDKATWPSAFDSRKSVSSGFRAALSTVNREERNYMLHPCRNRKTRSVRLGVHKLRLGSTSVFWVQWRTFRIEDPHILGDLAPGIRPISISLVDLLGVAASRYVCMFIWRRPPPPPRNIREGFRSVALWPTLPPTGTGTIICVTGVSKASAYVSSFY